MRASAPGALVAPALALLTSLCAAPALAEPQWAVGLTGGLAGAGQPGALWERTGLWSALRGDVVFLRERNADHGLGPYLELGTLDLGDLRAGGGGTVVLPWWDVMPFALSAGGYARLDEGAWEPGLTTDLFIGSRSYNYHSSYGLTAGLSLGYHHGLGDSRERTLVVAFRMDGMLAVIPFLFAYEAIKGAPAQE